MILLNQWVAEIPYQPIQSYACNSLGLTERGIHLMQTNAQVGLGFGSNEIKQERVSESGRRRYDLKRKHICYTFLQNLC